MKIGDTIEIRPIRPDEWLPDRCLTGSEPFDPGLCLPEAGCPSLNRTGKNTRRSLVQLYESTIEKYGACGFIAWHKNKVIAYHTFFPKEVAERIKFYGYGSESPDTTLIHNCLTIIKGNYLRKGISSRLVKESINWAKNNGWKRFEVHLVLPDCKKGWQSNQKGCLSFWEQFGFRVYKEYEAEDNIKEYYKVTKIYSVYLPLSDNDPV